MLLGTVFLEAVLHGEVLHGTVLHDAVLHGTVLHWPVLLGAVLHETLLFETVLLGKVLQGTVLRGVMLHGAMLHGAALTGAVTPRCTALGYFMVCVASVSTILGTRAYCCSGTGCKHNQLFSAVFSSFFFIVFSLIAHVLNNIFSLF